MKVYHLQLKRNDMFCVYLRDEQIITLITDEENPYPYTCDSWDKERGEFIRDTSVAANPQKVVFSSFRVQKEDMEDFLRVHIPRAIEKEMDLTVKRDGTYAFDERNILVLTKDGGDFLETGLGIFKGDYPTIHQMGQKICDSYLKLKAFW